MLTSKIGTIKLDSGDMPSGSSSELDRHKDIGPPAFVPGMPWKGMPDDNRDDLDPEKNPNLTPAILEARVKEREKKSQVNF